MSTIDLTTNAALTQLYREHHAWLLKWLRQQVACRIQAEDHAQDTFMRIIAAREVLSIREPRAYLTTIAKGILVNHWRRSAIEQAYWQAIAANPEQVAASPEHHAIILETLQEIDALLGQLPEKVRSAFLLSQLDGLTYAQIGQRLGVSERMVKKYMARAMLHCLLADIPGN